MKNWQRIKNQMMVAGWSMPSGLVGWYFPDNATDGDDYSDSARDLALTNVSVSGAATFNGSTSKASAQNAGDPIIPATGNWTIGVKILPDSVATAYQALVAQYNRSSAPDYGRIVFWMETDNLYFALNEDATYSTVDGTHSATISTSVAQWAWIWRDGGDIYMTVDTESPTSFTVNAAHSIQQTGNMIGSRCSSAAAWNGAQTQLYAGTIAHVVAFDNALTAGQRSGLMTNIGDG